MLKNSPHNYIIFFSVIVVATIFKWIIPPGRYLPEVIEKKGKLVTQMTFYFQDNLPEGNSMCEMGGSSHRHVDRTRIFAAYSNYNNET